MTVDRIGHIDPIQPGKKPGRAESAWESDRTDSIDLSSEARKKAEIYQIMELIKSAEETGEARIAELREKINNPSYINEQVLNATADNIIGAWLP
jgi:negative regulator of flagellin synthesis FlgM